MKKRLTAFLFSYKPVRTVALFYVYKVFWPVTTCLHQIFTPYWVQWNNDHYVYVNPKTRNPLLLNSQPKPTALHSRVVCISDLHGRQDKAFIPDGDILIVSGDITDFGPSHDPMSQALKLNKWLGTLTHNHKIIIAGNHDKALLHLGKEEIEKLFTNGIYLQDSSCEVNGVKIYGSPCSILSYSPNKAFQLPRRSEEIRNKWNEIPNDIDILVTHSPPHGYLDNKGGGCEYLTERIMEIKPKYHIFGHIHAAHGVAHYHHKNEDKYTTFINAATNNSLYLPLNRPIVFDIETKC